MGISLFKKKDFFSKEEKEQIVTSIRAAEKCTSGEIRVFVERRCRFMDALDRAKEIFTELIMENTEHRNAVLLYVATKDRQLAIYADTGIHEIVGQQFWEDEVNKILLQFDKANYANGISKCVTEIGEALQLNFPYHAGEDKNELPDEIIFGN
ncbi:MAG: TPM domain-containing protein [Chitinophagaceae bacterium]|nr:TPM domain-containing protein [Chitinophagaceae bacterium]